MPTLYETLGVASNSTQAEIKAAFKRMAHESHPDRDGGDEEIFQAINLAYAVLRDPEKRQHYDATGQTNDQSPMLLQMLAQLFFELLKKTDVVHDDIVACMIEFIADQRRQAHEAIEKMQVEIGRLEEVKKRLATADGKPNILEQLSTGQISIIIGACEIHRKNIANFDEMEKMLTGVSYRADPRKPVQNIYSLLGQNPAQVGPNQGRQ